MVEKLSSETIDPIIEFQFHYTTKSGFQTERIIREADSRVADYPFSDLTFVETLDRCLNEFVITSTLDKCMNTVFKLYWFPKN